MRATRGFAGKNPILEAAPIIYRDGLVTEALYSKSDKALMKLIRCFDKDERAFRIGGRVVEFTPMHVSQMLGLPNNGIQLKLHTKEGMKADYGKRYFAGLRQLDLTHVKHALKLIVRGTSEENIFDTVRLICLYLCTTLFFANTGNSVAWFIHNWMDDLDKMSSYGWSQVVHEWLIDDMIKKEERPSSVTGCAIVLLLREAPEETQGEVPIETPETRILKHKGKRSTISKQRLSVHKRIKTKKSKFPDNTNNQAPTNATTLTNEATEGLQPSDLDIQDSKNKKVNEIPSECRVQKDNVDKEQTQPNTTPDKSVVVQDMRKPTKKSRRLRLRHSSTPTFGDNTDDVKDSCLNDFGLDYTEKTKKVESNSRQVETDPSDVTGEELADIP
ncbi:hypothetical protein LguiB_022003 [Lonicera macranthoides]